MTCVVGIAIANHVVIGADACAGNTQQWLRVDVRQPKVFRLTGQERTGDFLIGYTTSFRMGQVLQHRLKPPVRREGMDAFDYLVTDFMDAVRAAFKHAGWLTKKDENESGGEFLVGYQSRLFEVASDFSVLELDGEGAVGCGNQLAFGALHATRPEPGSYPGRPDWRVAEAYGRVEGALRAAEAYSAYVRRPFTVEVLEPLGAKRFTFDEDTDPAHARAGGPS